MRKRLSLSQVVIKRKEERRNRRIRKFSIMTLVFIFIITTFESHHFEKARVVYTEKLISTIDSPTWADFKVSQGELHETVAQSNSDGVPNEVTINGERWSIIHVDHFLEAEKHGFNDPWAGISAETYCANKTIAYITTEDSQRLRIDLMHEIFHAGDCLHGGDKWWNSEHPTRTGHTGVYHLGEFMATFLHDNQPFAIWMTE